MENITASLRSCFGAFDITWIANMESEVFQVGNICVKVFPDTSTYTYELLQEYQMLTNTIAERLNGQLLLIPLRARDITLTIDIVTIDEIAQLKNGMWYTVSRFVPGPTLLQYHDPELTNQEFWRRIELEHGYETGQIIID